MIEINTLIETLNLGIKKNKSDGVCFKIPVGSSVALCYCLEKILRKKHQDTF